MELNTKSRRQLRLQGALFALLFLTLVGLVGWLSTQYKYQADWTASGRFSLSAASSELLAGLDAPVTITAFARGGGVSPAREQVRLLVRRYERESRLINLEFVDPYLAPDRVEALGVRHEGTLAVSYKGRVELLESLNEEALTNAILRLARGSERRILYVTGHGERAPHGEANRDYGEWTRQLESKGFRAGTVNLARSAGVPEDTAVLVIASPQLRYLPGEVEILRRYVAEGGNLLWLLEPGESQGLDALAKKLGLEVLPGTVVDPTAQLLGIENATFAIVADYPASEVTEALDTITLFPQAVALGRTESDWTVKPLLRTGPGAWSESGPLEGSVRFDPDADIAGPLDIGLLLTRERANGDEGSASSVQRVAVIGDGDFLSNTYLGNAGNQYLGSRLLNWLSHDDTLIAIPPRTSPDTQLTLSRAASLVIAGGFLVLIPLGLTAAGFTLWYRRRRR